MANKKKTLTEKQKLFCEYYVINYNATSAYIKAYGVSYKSGNCEGPRMLKNVNVKAEIRRLKKEISKNNFIEAKDIFNLMVKIAFSDISEYVEWGHTVEKERDMWGNILKDPETEKPYTYIKNFIKSTSSKKIDPQLISEISQGKDGFKIKLIDKKYALDYLIKFFEVLPDKFKNRIEEEKLKIDDLEGMKPPILVDSIEEKFNESRKKNEGN